MCLGSEGAACAEDCGGGGRWEYLKDLFRNPRKKDEDGLRQWYKTQCANGNKKGLNPWSWDILDVNDRLAELNKKWYGSAGI